jgi:hypothetical protein
MAVAAGCTFVGACAIAVHKFTLYGEYSLSALAPSSVHSVVGITALVSVAAQVISGALKRKNIISGVAMGMKWHGSLGKVCYYLCMASVALGVDSLTRRSVRYLGFGQKVALEECCQIKPFRLLCWIEFRHTWDPTASLPCRGGIGVVTEFIVRWQQCASKPFVFTF